MPVATDSCGVVVPTGGASVGPAPRGEFVLRFDRKNSRAAAWPRSNRAKKMTAFTLIELLVVIVIIGLLAALILPSLSAARTSANRAATKVRFNQWASAIESFRAEYGFYPQFDPSHLVNAGAPATRGGDLFFHDVLAGIHRDGSALAPNPDFATAAGQNSKLIAFHSFGENEFNSTGLLQDAFGNTEIVVLVDSDLDGFVKAGTDFPSLPAVHTSAGDAIVPGAGDFPPTGLHAGVVFYAADPKATGTNPLFIYSWK